MKSLVLSMLCLALLGATGCSYFDCPSSPPDNEPAPVTQKVLFEVEYVNHAWGHNHFGIWVDNSGAIWRYELAQGEWKSNGTGRYSGTELLGKYAHKKEYVGTVPADTLLKMSRLIESASRGASSDTVTAMADAGLTLYKAWLADAAPNTYREVGLRMRGDLTYDNLSPDARTIADWLHTLWETARK